MNDEDAINILCLSSDQIDLIRRCDKSVEHEFHVRQITTKFGEVLLVAAGQRRPNGPLSLSPVFSNTLPWGTGSFIIDRPDWMDTQ